VLLRGALTLPLPLPFLPASRLSLPHRIPESQPLPSFPLLRSCLSSHSNKLGLQVYFPYRLPRSRACQTPCLSLPALPPAPPLTQNSRAVIPRTFSHAPSSRCQCLFHIIPPRCMLTSRPVTQIRLSLKIAQSLKCLSSIAYLDLAVAPRLSSLRKIRTQDCAFNSSKTRPFLIAFFFDSMTWSSCNGPACCHLKSSRSLIHWFLRRRLAA
jgi:hypothetical protein